VTPASLLILTVAVLGVTVSAPIIAATAAPAMAIAFWRNAIASGVIAPLALLRSRREFRAMTRRQWLLGLAAGTALAAHFATWVPSLHLTSIASATAIVCSQPIWAALIARWRGEALPRRTWLAIGLAVLGVVLLTGLDFSLSPRALVGDLLALVGGLFAAVYVTLGGAVRQNLSTITYTTICYGTASVVLLVACVASGQALWGYSAQAWLLLAALVIFAQLLGHSMFNLVLRTISPMVISIAVLLEVPGAILIGAAWLHQIPPLAIYPALVLIMAGVGLALWQRTPEEEVPTV
jgi:drug/metabolite transporter (DMT)-like permease